MQNQQVTFHRLVGPPHLASPVDPYLMKAQVVVESVVEGCHPSCHQLTRVLCHMYDRLLHHIQVCVIVSEYCKLYC